MPHTLHIYDEGGLGAVCVKADDLHICVAWWLIGTVGRSLLMMLPQCMLIIAVTGHSRASMRPHIINALSKMLS